LVQPAYRGLALDIQITNTAGGAEVGCTLNKKGLNQEWSLNSKERIMFAIKGVQIQFKNSIGNFFDLIFLSSQSQS
jgi:hypothetical protein